MASFQSGARPDPYSSHPDVVDPFAENHVSSDILEQAIHGPIPGKKSGRINRTNIRLKLKNCPTPREQLMKTTIELPFKPPRPFGQLPIQRWCSDPVMDSNQKRTDSTGLMASKFRVDSLMNSMRKVDDKIPKLSDRDTPLFSLETHERDRQEFGHGKVADEYRSVGDLTPSKRSLSTLSKRSLNLVKMPGTSVDQMRRRTTAITASAPELQSRLWQVKSTYSSPVSSPREIPPIQLLKDRPRSGSPQNCELPRKPLDRDVNNVVVPKWNPENPSKRLPRKGASIEDPLEISDDETEDENHWDHLPDRLRVGETWIGNCRLVGHGPSMIVLDTFKLRNKKFTPYIWEEISIEHILRSVVYVRDRGRGSSFISLLIGQNHVFGSWSRQCVSRGDQRKQVWITVFIGDGSYIERLSKIARELPGFERLSDPLTHIMDIRPHITVPPCSASRLDSVSKGRRRLSKDCEILKYPPDGKDTVRISNGDIESLDPKEFLNDTIIDFKLAEIRRRHNNPRFHVFNSFFYKRFVTSKQSYDSVKRWADKEDLFGKDYWLIPINEMLHWTLAVVCNPNSTDASSPPVMLYFDSMGGPGTRAFGVIKSYVAAALATDKRRLRCRESILMIEKSFRHVDMDVPRQANSYDCGIYLLLFADKFMDEPPDLSNPHMPNWFGKSLADGHREVIRQEILNLSYEQDDAQPGLVCTDYSQESRG